MVHVIVQKYEVTENIHTHPIGHWKFQWVWVRGHERKQLKKIMKLQMNNSNSRGIRDFNAIILWWEVKILFCLE